MFLRLVGTSPPFLKSLRLETHSKGMRPHNMRNTLRTFNIIVISTLVAASRAQGSAGGYGQGSPNGYGQNAPIQTHGQNGNFNGGITAGFGGGGTSLSSYGAGSAGSTSLNRFTTIGGVGLKTAASDELPWTGRPEDESVQDLWQARSAILTPGDRVEYKFKLRAGETLLAGVTSDAFDPALSVVNDAGKELFKNDDRTEGDQSPFVVYRVPEAGTYTLKVLSYHGVAGGKFELKYRTFLAMDAGLGDQKETRGALTDADRRDRVVFRLQAKKGGIYDLREVSEKVGRNTMYIGLIRVLGPTGVSQSDFTLIPAPGSNAVFEALADGDYYLEYNGQEGSEYHTGIRVVQKLAVKDTCDESWSFEPSEIKIIEFPVTKDQIIRTTLSGSLEYAMSAPPDPTGQESNGQGEAYGSHAMWTWFAPNIDVDNDVVRVFHEGGNASMAIRSISGSQEKIGLKNTENLPTWDSEHEIKNGLKIGDSNLYLIKSTKSELMRVHIAAGHFVPRLDIFRMNGELANSMSDRTTLTAGDDLYFPDPGQFIVRVTCDGFGGSGDLTMHRQSLTASAYALGTAETMKLDGTNFGLYSVNLQAGKRYELITDNPGNYLRADLLDEDGQFLISQAIYLGDVEVQYFVPTRSGVHRLWLRGAPGTRHFKFQLNVPPKIGV